MYVTTFYLPTCDKCNGPLTHVLFPAVLHVRSMSLPGRLGTGRAELLLMNPSVLLGKVACVPAQWVSASGNWDEWGRKWINQIRPLISKLKGPWSLHQACQRVRLTSEAMLSPSPPPRPFSLWAYMLNLDITIYLNEHKQRNCERKRKKILYWGDQSISEASIVSKCCCASWVWNSEFWGPWCCLPDTCALGACRSLGACHMEIGSDL